MHALSWSARYRNLLTGHTAILLWLFAHVPFVVFYFLGLWRQQTHYQFFPFAIGAFLWLFPSRKRPGKEHWGVIPWTLILLDVLCITVGLLRSSPWMFAAGMCCVLLAWCWVSWDEGYHRRLTYLALLPLLTLRLPANGDMEVIQQLQKVTTSVASQTLERFGYLHVRMGNVLDFPGKRFMVEEACSGVQSLFTILFIAALLICIRRRSLAHGVILLASGVLFAGMMNMIRVITIAVAWDSFQYDLSDGIYHDMLGYAALAIAALLLISADSFLSFLTDAVPDVSRPDSTGNFRNPLTAIWNLLFAVIPLTLEQISANSFSASTARSSRTGRIFLTGVAGLACAALLLSQGFRLKGETSGALMPVSGSLTVLAEESLPDELAGFMRGAYVTETRHTTSELGEFSSLWDFSNRSLAARVACDYPFFGWHGLELCYTNQGWLVDDISSVGDDSGWQAVVVRMTHPTGGRHGIVLYSLFESTGTPLKPQGIGGTQQRILERLFRGTQTSLTAPIIYQSQVFTESALEFNDDQLRQLTDLHFASRAQMRQRIAGTDQ